MPLPMHQFLLFLALFFTLSHCQATSKGTYYLVRQDFRKCAAPLCGGYFLDSVNKRKTVCADGNKMPECYVAQLARGDSISEPAVPSNRALVQGTILPMVFPNLGNLGKLDIHTGFKAFGNPSAKAKKEKFALLKFNGIVCLTNPCFNIDALVLNRSKKRTLSEVDFSMVQSVPKGEIMKAERLVFGRGAGLIARGYFRKVKKAGPAGDGRSFVVLQFYFPVQARTNKED